MFLYRVVVVGMSFSVSGDVGWYRRLQWMQIFSVYCHDKCKGTWWYSSFNFFISPAKPFSCPVFLLFGTWNILRRKKYIKCDIFLCEEKVLWPHSNIPLHVYRINLPKHNTVNIFYFSCWSNVLHHKFHKTWQILCKVPFLKYFKDTCTCISVCHDQHVGAQKLDYEMLDII